MSTIPPRGHVVGPEGLEPPELIQARMANALLLLAEGLRTEDVAGLLYLDEASVDGWKDMFFKQNPKVA